MKLNTLYRRSAWYHRRSHLAVALGAAAATASLTGALLVGDSMRGSLRELALDRLGQVDHAVRAPSFFRAALASELFSSVMDDERTGQTAALILARSGVTHAQTKARVGKVQVLGVDESFWKFELHDLDRIPPDLKGRTALVNEPLAHDLGITVGDEILITMGKPSAISTETLLGRRDNTVASLRLTVRKVLPAQGLGVFGLNPRQAQPRNVYVRLDLIQRTLSQRARANVLLVGGHSDTAKQLQQQIHQTMTLDDLGLKLRVDAGRNYLSLESSAMLIPPPVESVALAVGKSDGLTASPSMTYLANSIEWRGGSDHDGARMSIPYSTVTALDFSSPTAQAFRDEHDQPLPAITAGSIVLNSWAANDLRAPVGSEITLTYFVTGAMGQLETREEVFTLAAIVALNRAAADEGFTPTYEGVTDVDNIADWDPPFPVDLKKVIQKDEDYWDNYHATPKAFISLEDGRRMWAEQGERFGRLTSIRFSPTSSGESAQAISDRFERTLLSAIDETSLGFTVEPVRERATNAGQGSTDFGGLFIGFSFFLIGSAAMLVALLFRLGVERRSFEAGLLLATGFEPRAVGKLFLTEGAVVALVGSFVGVFGAVGYAWLMLAGLRTWWSAAVNAPFLTLHILPTSLVIGFVASVLVAIASIAWSIRGVTRQSPRALLAGAPPTNNKPGSHTKSKKSLICACIALPSAAGLLVAPNFTDAIPDVAAFFGSASAALVGGLAVLFRVMASANPRLLTKPGLLSLSKLGTRNAPRHRGRSVLTAALIASASFLIVSLEAFHLDPPTTSEKDSGTGGFALFAESAVPLQYDLNTTQGRDQLNIPGAASEFEDIAVQSFRLRLGDESSCLNLYMPEKPRIVGAPKTFIERGGFRFLSTMAENDAQAENPWLLLNQTFDDGAIPVIGDESAVMWQLHSGLGKDFVIQDERGQDIALRFVALLSGSALQDELIVSEDHFIKLFPSVSGHSFFLIEAPNDQVEAMRLTLERELTPFGFDAGSTVDRLRDYLSVQNTYLSTFQTLGGLGLILGTFGLAAVLMRNVWERRSELSLLRAVGYSRGAVKWVVLVENIAMLLAGLFIGTASALIAVLPHAGTRPSPIPWASLSFTLLAVLVIGLAAGLFALSRSVRGPILSSLRSE